ncbi:MAG TPA: gliding motility-associated C-terminal domain-containing protein [Bacteroidales bacterium]|nr:gliding motility-associated C-terminal domain-containing protein [Bacteroidales bacterium]
MNELINNGPKNFDDYLKTALDNYQPDVSSGVWHSLKLQLFKKDTIDFLTFKKLSRSFNSATNFGAAQIKVLATYAAAACLAVGVVYGASRIYKSFFTAPTEKNSATQQQIIPSKSNVDNNTTGTKKAAVEQIKSSVPEKSTPKNKAVASLNDNNHASQAAIDNTPSNNLPATVQNAENAETHASLQNYIDKVTAPDKPSVKETPVQSLPETIDIPEEPVEYTEENKPDPYTYNLEIPNVITPNGDGYNDLFKIKNLDKYPTNTLTIASRNGQVVFETTNYQNNWDAQHLDAGTYYYILSYKDNRQNKGIIKGTVSVVR